MAGGGDPFHLKNGPEKIVFFFVHCRKQWSRNITDQGWKKLKNKPKAETSFSGQAVGNVLARLSTRPHKPIAHPPPLRVVVQLPPPPTSPPPSRHTTNK